MIPKRLTPVLAAILFGGMAAGCATTQPGWRGEDAAPFDGALASCEAEAEAAAASGRGERDVVLEACMERHGWHRDPPRLD